MESLQPRHCRNSLGLTLIEVLIALAIISIAMTAVIKASSQNIRGTQHLQQKSAALWVGQQVLNEVSAGVVDLSSGSDSVKQKTTQFGQDWYWQASKEATPNKRIAKIEVQVFTQEEHEEATPIITLESYVYDEK
jgi:general secretion pathway protein I